MGKDWIALLNVGFLPSSETEQKSSAWLRLFQLLFLAVALCTAAHAIKLMLFSTHVLAFSVSLGKALGRF